MKILFLLYLLVYSIPVWAQTDNHYLSPGKVVLATPLEEDVMKVHIALGYCTVLEFPRKPTLVTVGDNSLIQVEIPKDSNSVVIKALQPTGETNLFVFTADQRFNYKVSIGASQDVDYVLDAESLLKIKSKPESSLTLDKVLKMARSYGYLRRNHLISDQEFERKLLDYQCAYPIADIDLVETFSNKKPNFLILHAVIQNQSQDTISLNEQNTAIFIGGKKFIPQYVLFDSDRLASTDKTDGWLVLENSFLSIDNKFSISVGIEDEQYECKQSFF